MFGEGLYFSGGLSEVDGIGLFGVDGFENLVFILDEHMLNEGRWLDIGLEGEGVSDEEKGLFNLGGVCWSVEGKVGGSALKLLSEFLGGFGETDDVWSFSREEIILGGIYFGLHVDSFEVLLHELLVAFDEGECFGFISVWWLDDLIKVLGEEVVVVVTELSLSLAEFSGDVDDNGFVAEEVEHAALVLFAFGSFFSCLNCLFLATAFF